MHVHVLLNGLTLEHDDALRVLKVVARVALGGLTGLAQLSDSLQHFRLRQTVADALEH